MISPFLHLTDRFRMLFERCPQLSGVGSPLIPIPILICVAITARLVATIVHVVIVGAVVVSPPGSSRARRRPPVASPLGSRGAFVLVVPFGTHPARLHQLETVVVVHGWWTCPASCPASTTADRSCLPFITRVPLAGPFSSVAVPSLSTAPVLPSCCRRRRSLPRPIRHCREPLTVPPPAGPPSRPLPPHPRSGREPPAPTGPLPCW